MQIHHLLERYRPLVEDFSAFVDACRSPLPLVIWRNSLRSPSVAISDWLHADRHGLEPCRWFDDAFRVANPDSLEYLAAYLSGLFHIQEEIALLPVLLLDPRPGERILDLCAAPGNKTAQISAAMQATGTVVSNDASRKRMGVLRTTMDRLGLTNVVLTISNASDFPVEYPLYDRVLVDAPCSCEGMSRKNPSILRKYSVERSERLSRLQRLILERAIRLCRPGGRIVYATCTYAPEENECVVASVLDNPVGGARVRLIKPEVPGLRFSTGLTRWRGESLPPELQNSFRVWPHQNDTGGFYVAVLEKEEGAAVSSGPYRSPVLVANSASGSSAQPVCPRADIDRFDFDTDVLSLYRSEVLSRKYTSLVGRDVQFPSSPIILAAGVRAINTKGSDARLSTAGAMLLGPAARKSIVDLSVSDMKYFLGREDITAMDAWLGSPGSVLVRSKNVTFGLGSISSTSGTGVLRSFFPRTWAGVDVAARLSALGADL